VDIEGLSRDPNEVKFYFTRTWGTFVELPLNDSSVLEGSGFKKSHDTVVLIDGFDSPRTPFYKLAFDAFMANNRQPNIILVDYRKLSGRESPLAVVPLSSIFLYLNVLQNVDVLGERVGHFLHFLHSQGGIAPSNLHLVGMSMGCHVAGAASVFFKQKTGGLRIGRITGLDPAVTVYPLRVVTRLRASHKSADFIDSYHTNRGTLGEIVEETADMNVYINGGSSQPGCEPYDQSFKPYPGLCSHLYAWEWFAASFSQDYPACPCREWECYCQKDCRKCRKAKQLRVGIHAPSWARGTYHLASTSPKPGVYFRKIRDIFKANNDTSSSSLF